MMQRWFMPRDELFWDEMCRLGDAGRHLTHSEDGTLYIPTWHREPPFNSQQIVGGFVGRAPPAGVSERESC